MITQEMKNAFNLIKIIQFSEQAVKNGNYKTASNVFTNLRRKYNTESFMKYLMTK